MFGPVSGSQAPLKDTRYVASDHCLRVPRDTRRSLRLPYSFAGKGRSESC